MSCVLLYVISIALPESTGTTLAPCGLSRTRAGVVSGGIVLFNPVDEAMAKKLLVNTNLFCHPHFVFAAL
ncbi:MAG TPA: hypothetical protein VF918_19245 [Anaerolineales bacterium]